MAGHDSGGDFALLQPSRDVVAAWEMLATASGAVPFARPGWCLAWANAFQRPLRVAAVTRGGQIAAVLPVVVGRGRVVTATDWHVPFTDALAEDEAALKALFAGLARFRRVSVDFVLAGSASERAATAALQSRPTRRIVRLRSPFVDTSGSFEAYCDGLETKKLRELRRRRRRLEEELGEVEYCVTDGSGDWEGALDDGIAIEASGWKGVEGTAVASDAATARFYRAVAGWAAEVKLLEVGTLRAGGRPVAFDLALSDGASVWLLKTGFDHELGKFAPGTQLRHDALRRAFERGLATYEFTGEAEPWKDEWTRSRRRVLLIDAFAPGSRGVAEMHAARLGRAVRVQARRLVRRLR